MQRLSTEVRIPLIHGMDQKLHTLVHHIDQTFEEAVFMQWLNIICELPHAVPKNVIFVPQE